MKKYFYPLVILALFFNTTTIHAQLDSILYHDGVFESQWGSSTGNDQFKLFVRVTPASYPATLVGIRAYFRNAPAGATFKWNVYEDLGGAIAGGVTQIYISPNALANPAAGGAPNVTYTGYIDLTSSNLTIASGDFYVGVSEANNNGFLGLAMDQLPATNAYDDRQWQYLFGGWNTMVSQATSGQFGITAFFPSIAMSIADNFHPETSGSILVYPNPVSDNCTITLPDNFSGLSVVKILNLQGELVMDEVINSFSARLNLQGLAKGIYILSVQNDSQTLTGKLIRD